MLCLVRDGACRVVPISKVESGWKDVRALVCRIGSEDRVADIPDMSVARWVHERTVERLLRGSSRKFGDGFGPFVCNSSAKTNRVPRPGLGWRIS
jgi:hypothetical protein